MKIVMFGRGVISTLYGWAFAQAGHDVEFYVRPGRAATYESTITIDVLDSRQRSKKARASKQWSPRYLETLPPDHDFDLIVLSVPHYRLAEAVEFLAPRSGSATVLIFGNLWQEPLEAVALLPADQLAWGFPQGGGGFDATGSLRGMLLSSVLFGHFGQTLTQREVAVRNLFREAGFRVREQDDFRGWLLMHTVMDAGLYSQALRHGSMAALVGNTAALREALLVGRELLPLVEARGVDLSTHRRTSLMLQAPSWLPATAMSLATRYVPAARRAFDGHADPGAMEPRLVCRDVAEEARRVGVPTPRLSAVAPLFADTQNP